MSTLETNTIDTISGSTTLTLGGTNANAITIPSGVTMSVPSGGLSGQNYPAFLAYPNADQTLTDATTTKVVFNTEDFDTNNCFDSTTNYRFTPTVAGKYFCYTSVSLGSTTYTNSNLNEIRLLFYKNGAKIKQSIVDFLSNPIRYGAFNMHDIISFNGSTDYLEIYARNDVASGTPNIQGDSSNRPTYFGAFRIGA